MKRPPSRAPRVKAGLFLLLLPAVLFLWGCGVDDYPHVNSVPQSNITQTFNNYAEVRLPPGSNSFTHYVIFYRIYVSDVSIPSTTYSDTASYSAINPALSSDFYSIRQYIGSDTLVNANMDAVFRARGYSYLCLESSDIDSVLNSSSTTLSFSFPTSENPYMTKGGARYVLWRSNGNGAFSPRPDRYFRNKPGLYESGGINAQTNADVADKPGMSGADRYTYAAMFIVAVGVDNTTYSNIYSTPAFIHVFQLPG
jgi:hypothetical protein